MCVQICRDRFTPGPQERWRPSPSPADRPLLLLILCAGRLARDQFNFRGAHRPVRFHPFIPSTEPSFITSSSWSLSRLSTKSLPATLKSLCLSSVLAALRLRDGSSCSINQSLPPAPTPTGPLSSVSLLLTNTTFFFAIPEPDWTERQYFLPHQVRPGS